MHIYFLILTVFNPSIENPTKQTWPCVCTTWLYMSTHYIMHFQMIQIHNFVLTYLLLCHRSLLKIGGVDMVVEVTAEGRFLVVAWGAAATSRPWVMMTALIPTPVPKPHPSPLWLLRGMPSDDLSAWIKGHLSQMGVMWKNSWGFSTNHCSNLPLSSFYYVICLYI